MTTRKNNDPRKQRPAVADDLIEEYIFSSDHDPADNDGYDSDAARSHISLSSSSSPATSRPAYALDERPWLQMDRECRRHYENMFLNITSPAVGGSWAFTEEYQKQVDELMLKYMEDFPLATWVIGQQAADVAYNHLQERVKWRQFGIRVYKAHQLPELFRSGPYSSIPGQLASAHQQQSTSSTQLHLPAVQPAPATSKPPSIVNPTTVTKSSSGSNKTAQQHASLNAPATPSAFNPAGASAYASILLFHANENRSAPPKNPLESEHSTPDDDSDFSTASRKRKRKSTPISQPRPITPPYPDRKRASEVTLVQNARRPQSRRQAEAQIYPWHRKLDFKAAKAAAEWNDDYRTAKTINEQASIHAHNRPIFQHLENVPLTKQGHVLEPKKQESAKQMVPYLVDSDSPLDSAEVSDTSSHGSLGFATVRDQNRAESLNCRTAQELIERGENGLLASHKLQDIRLRWHSNMKGAAHGLQQLTFTAMESIITRQKLAETPIFTADAALCIIDFCPDLLWRETLLRICSETGMGNKDVRERFGLNGYFTNQATFTKRISSALGLKHAPAKQAGQSPGDREFYEQNNDDFEAYINFFGTRTATRRTHAGVKRRRSSTTTNASDAEGVIQVTNKRTRLLPLETDGAADSDTDYENVSAQDSDDLDYISD